MTSPYNTDRHPPAVFIPLPLDNPTPYRWLRAGLIESVSIKSDGTYALRLTARVGGEDISLVESPSHSRARLYAWVVDVCKAAASDPLA